MCNELENMETSAYEEEKGNTIAHKIQAELSKMKRGSIAMVGRLMSTAT